MKANKPCKLKALYTCAVNKEFHFAKHIKNALFATIGLFLVAVVVFAFVGFNSGFAFHDGYQMNISFHTEIIGEQRSEFSGFVKDALQENGFNNYELVQVGNTHDSGIIIKVKSNLSYDNAILALENVSSEVVAQIEATGEIAYLEISDPVALQPSMASSDIWLAVLAVVLTFVSIAVYVIIRYDWSSLAAFSITNMGSIMAFLAFTTLFRIPVSALLFIGLVALQLLNGMLSVNHFAKLKEGFDKETLTKLTNAQVANIVAKSNLLSNLVLFGVGFMVGVALLGIGLSQAIEIGAYLIIISLLATGANTAITVWIWSLLFNREQDKRYIARLQKKNAPKKTEDDKAVI